MGSLLKVLMSRREYIARYSPRCSSAVKPSAWTGDFDAIISISMASIKDRSPKKLKTAKKPPYFEDGGFIYAISPAQSTKRQILIPS